MRCSIQQEPAVAADTDLLLTFYFRTTSSHWKSVVEEYASRGMPLWSLSEIWSPVSWWGTHKPQKLLSRPKQSTSITAVFTDWVRSVLDQDGVTMFHWTFPIQSSWPLSINDLCVLSAKSIAGIVDSQIFVPFKASAGLIHHKNSSVLWFHWKVKTLLHIRLMTQAAFPIISPESPKSKAPLFVFLTRAALLLCNKRMPRHEPVKESDRCCDKLLVY